MAKLRGLIDTYYSDFKTPESYNNAANELATRPEFKPILLEMLQRDYFQALQTLDKKPDDEALGPLSLRADLTAEEQKLFTDEMERLMGNPASYSFMNGSINLLAHYPSTEHENLVLRVLARARPQNQDHTLEQAFKTLSVIGGAKSLKAMLQVIEPLKKTDPNIWFLPELESSVTVLETRLKKGAPVVNISVEPLANQTLKSSTPAKSAGAAAAETPDNTMDWRVLLGLVSGLLFVIALACQAFRAKGQ
jgi:hypothetical protein